MDLLKNLTNLPEPAKSHGSDTEKMIDKITEAFEGLSHNESAPKTPAVHTGGGGGLMDKISGTFEGHQKTAEKTHKDNGGLMDKISGAIGGHQKPVETHKDEGGLMDKISDVVGGHHQKPVEEGGIMGHINNALGGGQAGEKKEGKHRALIARLLQLMFPRDSHALDKGSCGYPVTVIFCRLT
jgi:hypothetical protein